MGKLIEQLIVRWFTEDADAIKRRLDALQAQGDKIMATVEEVQTAIAEERVEVQGKLDALAATVQALSDQIAAGTAATPEQLGEILTAIRDISEPIA